MENMFLFKVDHVVNIKSGFTEKFWNLIILIK